MAHYEPKEIDLDKPLAQQVKPSDMITGIGEIDTIKMGGVLDISRRFISWYEVREILDNGGKVFEKVD